MLIKKIITISMLLFLSSCGYNWGYMPMHQSGVVMDEANYTYVGNATGEASSMHILGFGPFSSQTLVSDAKANMLKKVDLYNGSRAIVNMTVDEKVVYLLFGVKRTVYISADIIEFK